MQLRMYKRRIINKKLQKGAVKLKYVPTKEHVADVLTNPLSHAELEHIWYKLGVFKKNLTGKREWLQKIFEFDLVWQDG